MSNVRELTNAELDFVGGGDINVGSLVFLNDFEHANIGTVGTNFGTSIGLFVQKQEKQHHKMV